MSRRYIKFVLKFPMAFLSTFRTQMMPAFISVKSPKIVPSHNRLTQFQFIDCAVHHTAQCTSNRHPIN